MTSFEHTGHISFGVDMKGKVKLLTSISFASIPSFSPFSRLPFRVRLRELLISFLNLPYHPSSSPSLPTRPLSMLTT